MPYEKFDRSLLNILPLDEREHDIDLSKTLLPLDYRPDFENPDIQPIANALVNAKRRGATALMMYGAHVIRSGCGLFMIELMKRGLITHFATNGAGSIHDFEFALIGETCESVAKYISRGQFGLWRESGLHNDILAEGVRDGLGAGEAIGRYIWENNLPGRETSALAQGYHLRVPCTVHIGIGNDITHEHPNCSGAVLGEASYNDFLIYTKSLEKLEGGAFLNFGSAVAGPEVYLKALSMVRNVAHQKGEEICRFTTAVFDMHDFKGGDFTHEPPKTDARYYYRPWKTILTRTVADGGTSYYVCGTHNLTVPAVAHAAFALDSEGSPHV